MELTRLAIIGLILALNLIMPLRAQYNALPPCTRAEFLKIFNLAAEFQLELASDINGIASLLSKSRIQNDNHQNSLSELPVCADAFDYQRLVIELSGDFIGRNALDIANVPRAENPYRVHLAGDQERIEKLVSAMLGVDRSQAATATERNLRHCSDDELKELDERVDALLTLLDTSDAGEDLRYKLLAIDARLQWREAQLRQAPACAEGVELALLMSAAATESAASFAIASIATGDENPYVTIAAESIARLENWQDQLAIDQTERSQQSFSSGGLRACRLDELSLAFDKLMPEYSNLLEDARRMKSASDLKRYSEAFFSFRATSLAQLPPCAEAYTVGWEVRQLLGDLVPAGANDLVALAGNRDPFTENLNNSASRVAHLIDDLAKRVEGGSGPSSSTANSNATACSRADILFMQFYLIPDFHEFTEAALSIKTWEALFDLVDLSLAFRDLLWRELPRCSEALELGLVMRRIAADFIALIWLEVAGMPAVDIPHLRTVVQDISLFSMQSDDLFTEYESVARAATSYYIIAEHGANIRGCESTECVIVATALRGETIQVVDESGSWYQVNLPDDQVGYIASFLVSTSPPG